MAPVLQLKIDQKVFDGADKALRELPDDLKLKAILPAARAAAKVVKDAQIDEFKKRFNSALTGSRERQSRKVKQSRPETHTYETIAIRAKSYGSIEMMIIGPGWPEGNLVNFTVSSFARPLWGSGRTMTSEPKGTDIAIQAGEESKEQQMKAFRDTLERRGQAELEKLKKT